MSIAKLRQQIDQLDRKLLRLLNDRLRLAAQIGKQKQRQGRSVFAPEREEQLLRSLKALNRGPLSDAALRAIYREIISCSRSLQGSIRIGFLKPDAEGDRIVRSLFGVSDRSIPFSKGGMLFKALGEANVDLAVISLEALSQTPMDSLRDWSLYARVRSGLASQKNGMYWVFCRHALDAERYDGAILRFPAVAGGQSWRILQRYLKALGLKSEGVSEWTDAKRRWHWVEVEGSFSKSKIEEWRKTVQTYSMAADLMGCFCQREL